VSAEPWIVARAEPTGLLLWRAGQERTCAAIPGAVVGDRVRLDEERPHLLPRLGALTRAAVDGTSREQVLAANVDVVLIVEPFPRPNRARIDRLIVLAWGSGGSPVVVLTKSDQAPPTDAERFGDGLAAELPGVPVLVCSTTTGQGLARVSEVLPGGRVGILVGPSGAGKSTLVNHLAGETLMATGPVRAVDGKGRHTTSHRELLVLPGGGLLIDTPGVRAVGLTGDTGAIEQAYSDVAELAQQCRFSDCAHDGEPGCAVAAAVVAGHLPQRRLDGWRRLQREASYQQIRGDARARSEASRAIRGRSRLGREARRFKGDR
jgi:ribosome biogenesis GTPase